MFGAEGSSNAGVVLSLGAGGRCGRAASLLMTLDAIAAAAAPAEGCVLTGLADPALLGMLAVGVFTKLYGLVLFYSAAGTVYVSFTEALTHCRACWMAFER